MKKIKYFLLLLFLCCCSNNQKIEDLKIKSNEIINKTIEVKKDLTTIKVKIFDSDCSNKIEMLQDIQEIQLKVEKLEGEEYILKNNIIYTFEELKKDKKELKRKLTSLITTFIVVVVFLVYLIFKLK